MWLRREPNRACSLVTVFHRLVNMATIHSLYTVPDVRFMVDLDGSKSAQSFEFGMFCEFPCADIIELFFGSFQLSGH